MAKITEGKMITYKMMTISVKRLEKNSQNKQKMGVGQNWTQLSLGQKVKVKTGVHHKLVLEAEAFHLQVRLECVEAAGLSH